MRLLFALDLEKINHIQGGTLLNALRRSRHAHYTNLYLRINGEDVVLEADWFKHFETNERVLESMKETASKGEAESR